MTQLTGPIPAINTDEFWLQYLSHGMYIGVPVTGFHKKNGIKENKRWCANSLALRDLHPKIYDSIVEREGVSLYFDFDGVKVRFNLGLDIPARKIADANDKKEYSDLDEEEIESSLINMIYVGSKKVRMDTAEQKKRKMEGQKVRRAIEQEQMLKTSGHVINGDSANSNEAKKDKKTKVKSHTRISRRPSRWAL